jgi:hypothetical protein
MAIDLTSGLKDLCRSFTNARVHPSPDSNVILPGPVTKPVIAEKSIADHLINFLMCGFAFSNTCSAKERALSNLGVNDRNTVIIRVRRSTERPKANIERRRASAVAIPHNEKTRNKKLASKLRTHQDTQDKNSKQDHKA